MFRSSNTYHDQGRGGPGPARLAPHISIVAHRSIDRPRYGQPVTASLSAVYFRVIVYLYWLTDRLLSDPTLRFGRYVYVEIDGKRPSAKAGLCHILSQQETSQ